MTHNDTNKELQNKVKETEQLISQSKSELKNWANQISKYHKNLKEISAQLEAIKSQLKN